MTSPWTAGDAEQTKEAAAELDVWPLDEYNAKLLNEVHPRGYVQSCETPHEEYDLIAIGSGAGGLVSSKQVRDIGSIIWSALLDVLSNMVSLRHFLSCSPLDAVPRVL